MTVPALHLYIHTPDPYVAQFHIGRANWDAGHWSRFRKGEDAIMGARLWSRLVATDVYHCVLHVSNGVLENDGTHKGGVFYQGFELIVPDGWQVHHLPRFQPFPASGAHYIASRFHFTRRFLVCKAVPENALDILCGSLSGHLTSNGPANSTYTWPKSDRAQDTAMLVSRISGPMPQLAYAGANPDGTPKWIAPNGPIMGYGNVTDAGEQGGGGIFLCPAIEQTVAGGAYHVLVGDLTSERNPIACYNSDGSFATRETGLGVGFEYRMDGGRNWIQYIPPFGVRSGEQWGYKYWNRDNGCPYRGLQESMTRVDRYHLIRAFYDDLSAWMLTGDPACRHRLRLAGEDLRISDTLLALQGLWDQAWSLKANLAKANHKGGSIQRGEAWTALLGAAQCELTPSATWTDWCLARAELAAKTMMPSGAMYMGWSPDSDQGEPWQLGLATTKQEQPSWQTPFLISGLFALWQQLGQPADLKQTIVKIGQGLYFNSCPLVQFEDHPESQYGKLLGLPRYLVTATTGTPVPAMTEGVGPARGYYDAHALALLYRADPRASWINRMCMLGKPVPNAQARLADISTGDPMLNAEAQSVLTKYVERHP